MQSRGTRLTLAITACVTLSLSATFVFRNERDIGRLNETVREFEQHARDADAALSDMRSGQQAYVAAGQGIAFWTPRVAAATTTLSGALDALGRSTADVEARAALDRATVAIADFRNVDARARELLTSGQLLMAGDTIFADGATAVEAIGRQLSIARAAEQRTADARESGVRRQEAIAIGSGAALAGIVIVLLVAFPVAESDAATRGGIAGAQHSRSAARAPEAPLASATPVASENASTVRTSSAIVTAAALATDFGTVRDADGLARLLGRTAEAIDATGLVVWMSSADGMTLQPALTHGYSPQMIARIQPMPRSSDNAAAAAYRASKMQIVLARPGGGNGAVVAPILSADGCVGVLSAEIRGGAETSEEVQALAGIVAAHLAGVVTVSPDAAIEKRVANS